MRKEEYQSKIPIFCKFQTAKEHTNILMLCWSISNGRMKYRGVEGPQYCHNCDASIRAKRWEKVWYKRFLNGTLPDF